MSAPKTPLAESREACSAIDQYITKHLHQQTSTLNESLARATEACKRNGIPNWSSTPSQGKFIMLQVRISGARNVLEIGALGGHGAIWCAGARPSTRVTTIERNAHYAKIACQNVHDAGLRDRVVLILGDAVPILGRLQAEITRGVRERFDFVLVDSEDMMDTWELITRCASLCTAKACILAHGTLRNMDLGVATAEEQNTRSKGTRELVERIGSDERFDAGYLMCVGEEPYDVFMATLREQI